MFRPGLTYSLLVLFVVHRIKAQDDPQSRCYDYTGRAQKCTPEFVNAAFNIAVEATNTCGTTRPTEYCLQTGVTGPKKACEICDGGHPAEYLTDFNNNDNQTRWQSETMYDGIQYPSRVNLTLKLGKAFDITYVRLKFHTSRPESFAIHKRTKEDGPWIPYQYYSNSCPSTYDISAKSYVSRHNETNALCTNEYSDISPLSGGNVAFSTLEGRPSAHNFDNSPLLQEWVTATDIRITLDRLNTFGDEIFGDPKVLKSYYYAISDLAVGGRCKCNGHAGECVIDPHIRKLRCRCTHFTAGSDCNECLPFYNDLPWRKATASDAHECKPCNCNGRSNRCRFDQELYDNTGHGGHCYDCTENTDGPHCERCKENFYQLDDGRCVHCSCNPTGSRSLQCNHLGQCFCKPGVEGQHCDRCAQNFYEFSNFGCKPCGCNMAGSVDNEPNCDSFTGVCRCKYNVEGQRCDKCKPGNFDLQATNQFGCLPCFCFGHSSVCSSSPGFTGVSIESTFTRGKDNWNTIDLKGQEVSIQYNTIGQNIGVSAPGREAVYFDAPARYLGDQRFSYNQFLKFSLRIGEESPRATLEDVIIEGGNKRIMQPIFGQGNPLPSIHSQEYKFRFHEDSVYGWNPRLSSSDFISILSNITAIRIKATYLTQGTGYIDNVRLQTAQQTSGMEATWVENCDCPVGYVGQFCESCKPGYRHDPLGSSRFSRCVPCNCNGHDELCQPETGACICKDNTAGDNCERCASGYYGNAIFGTPDDCQPCPCPNQGACVILPNEQVACLQCPKGYAGHKCDLCVDGYHGDPAGIITGVGSECTKCGCNQNIDPNGVGNCNTTTGACLKCIYNTDGEQCEKCLPGFYGDALAEEKGDCKACNCYASGTSRIDLSVPVLLCDEESGQCPCLPNVEGKMCNQCQEGYFNIASGIGCEECNCDPIGAFNATCDVHTGQCFCRPGVTGSHCDQCLPYHYGFSLEGCKLCNCDHIGSIHLQCSPTGQCECRANVEGRRCEKCKENKYNKEAGCIDCPPCYNLIQEAVDFHREKIQKLSQLLEAIRDNPDIVGDENFGTKLKEVQDRVNELYDKATGDQGSDGNLIKQIKEMQLTLKDIDKISSINDAKINDAKMISKTGQNNIGLAEEAISKAKNLLIIAEEILKYNGSRALKSAQEKSQELGQQNEEITRIAKEAKNSSLQLEQESNLIMDTSLNALNVSMEAHSLANNLENYEYETFRKINDLKDKVEPIAQVMEVTKALANATLANTRKVYDESFELNKTVQSLRIPTVDVELLKEETKDIKDQAMAYQEKINNFEEAFKMKEESFDDVKNRAQDLIEDAERQEASLNSTYNRVKGYNETANEAVEKGEKILEYAKNTLEILKGFDESIQNSKQNASLAKEKIPAIEALLETTNQKIDASDKALDNITATSQLALAMAKSAEKLAKETSKDANTIKESAQEIKLNSGKLKTISDNLTEAIIDANLSFAQNEDQFEIYGNASKRALEESINAQILANSSLGQVENALTSVLSIIDALDKLESIDEKVLDDLTEKLDKLEVEIKEANLEARKNEMKQNLETNKKWMKEYADEIETLKKDKENIEAISSSLQLKCYRRVQLEP